nr:FliM/FliN family flagellar motor C-terminal domain-containing protein [Novosphingobium flavum]
MPLPTLAAALGSAPRGKPAPRKADPLAAPFAEIDLPLRAVLVEMRMSMSALAALEPGMVVPVAVARQVPLCHGNRTIATGTVGAADDRVALQITRAF